MPTVPAPVPGPLSSPETWDRISFSRMDKDGDGVLSRNEMPETKKSIGRFARFDADRDGNIDQKEYLIGRHWERLTQALPSWVHRAGSGLKAFGQAEA